MSACRQCGQELPPKKGPGRAKVFCAACFAARVRERDRARNRSVRSRAEWAVCQRCKGHIPEEAQDHRRRYCSPCAREVTVEYRRAYRARTSISGPALECGHCGKDFCRTRGRPSAPFCSRACRIASADAMLVEIRDSCWRIQQATEELRAARLRATGVRIEQQQPQRPRVEVWARDGQAGWGP